MRNIRSYTVGTSLHDVDGNEWWGSSLGAQDMVQAVLGRQSPMKLEAKEPSCDEEDDGDNKLKLTAIHKTCREVLFKGEMAKPDVDIVN